ncbi:hypothetical protein B5S31_g5322 [[Candida] boidinii]|uniref:Unnamed protein product n=1 Tax=Candida boidinii TaxID=5477 RepID=A0ACB5TPC0_CANBO|nr:hypothetical protein B5S29_g4481 [[Candida] boidinii]OWB75425.1 hypothetical protein B5S31_g5322 [[Candida] boidinii]GME92272.1 unnamed protein product [[Candida] boidinii]GMF02997.1 unnamed protein product [[Candida] boidinii]
MFKLLPRSYISPINSSLLRATYATTSTSSATTTTTSNENIIQQQQQTTDILPNATIPPNYVLTTLRSFPSLEPHSIFPVHSKLFNLPLRRDILWSAVVMELDNRRVGSSNPPGRSDHKFSRHKLFKQKGTGRARVGDANSPIRWRGAYALARTAPNDFSTTLPSKLYRLAYRIALSDYYKNNKLFIIGEEMKNNEDQNKIKNIMTNKLNDSFNLEITNTDSIHSLFKFNKIHNFKDLNLLFIPNNYDNCENLIKIIEKFGKKANIIRKEDIQIRDILKANRIFMEKDALLYFASQLGKDIY